MNVLLYMYRFFSPHALILNLGFALLQFVESNQICTQIFRGMHIFLTPYGYSQTRSAKEIYAMSIGNSLSPGNSTPSIHPKNETLVARDHSLTDCPESIVLGKGLKLIALYMFCAKCLLYCQIRRVLKGSPGIGTQA